MLNWSHLIIQTKERCGGLILTNYKTLKRECILKYKCKCGNEHSKMVRSIVKYGMYCKDCIKQIKNEKTKKSWLQNYNVDNPSKSDIIKEKKKNTSIKNFGVEYPSQHPKIKQKIQQTNLEKYGNICSLHDKEIHERVLNICLEKYGCTIPSKTEIIKQKTIQTCLKKYGASYHLQSEDVKQKIKETCIQKYGSHSVMHDRDIFEKNQKSRFKCKIFKFKSGQEIKVQGYEIYALELLEKKYKFEEIKIGKDVPSIDYLYNNKKCRYFPDIFIPKENLIIEVKSDYTYNADLEINLVKQNFTKEMYNYEIWVFDKKKNLQIK